jgi:hypothetical protein
LSTEPRRPLTPANSKGFALVEFAKRIGHPLLPWQETAAIRALELNADGTYRFRTVLILVGRQSGKTTFLKVWALWRLYEDNARLVLGAAQSLDIAREAWSGSVDIADEAGLPVSNVRRANGEQCLSLPGGARYRITAATRGAGRGLSVDMLIMDEVREQRDWAAWSALSKTILARPLGQVVCISNAGDDESVVLNSLREAALAGKDDTIGLFEWSAPDGCDLNDPEAWVQSLPGLGHIVSESTVRSAIATDPPAVARTELLCQHVTAMDAAIEHAGWQAGADPGGSLGPLRGSLSAGIDVSVDGNHVALVAASMTDDGRVRVEPVAAWETTAACRAELPEILAALNPVSLAWFPNGPAAVLSTYLKTLPYGRPIAPAELASACMGFADLARAGMILHNSDALLDGQVAKASKLARGDGYVFTRRGSGNCNALYAACGAVLCARTAKPARGPRWVL